MINALAIREKAVFVATRNMYGESDANNDGEFIRAMGGIPGEEWCALYVGYCHRRANQLLGLPDPQWCWRRYPGRLEVGAKALAKALAHQSGSVWFNDPRMTMPGDLVVWHRSRMRFPWQGHIGIVVKHDNTGWPWANEGNVGRFPAHVICRPVKQELLVGFAGLR